MITPVLLCGGSGTRLWPLSRKSYPKQFVGLMGQKTLFQASAERFSGADFAAPLLVTGEAFRFIVQEQLDDIGMAAQSVWVEPQGRNTGPAALAAALILADQNPEALMLLSPSDHVVQDPAAFRDAVRAGVPAAQEGQIVTFGIAPSRPETGYGWIEAGQETHPAVRRLARFIEKPDAAMARTLFQDGRYLWNAGVFLARADAVIAAFQTHAPDVLAAVKPAIETAQSDLHFTRLDAPHWSKVPDISIDYAVMEKIDTASVVRFEGHWSDLGDWAAVWQESPKDESGNALSAHVTALDCENTLLRSETEGIEVVGIGLKDIVTVAMHDAVIVADMADSQNVKTAVSALKAKQAKQAETLPVAHRPWGWFETLIAAERFQVKRIHVIPGGILSLQSHLHRSEHWIVVAGTAKVTIEGVVTLLSENQSAYIPLGARHRLENPGKVPMVLIEVQTGAYLDEDDITRYEDAYARR